VRGKVVVKKDEATSQESLRVVDGDQQMVFKGAQGS